MKFLPGSRPIRYFEGAISNWRLARGYVYLSIGRHALCLRESRVTEKFKNRNTVQVMLREPLHGDGVSEVLVWQRRGHERVHYVGRRASPALIFAATLVSSLGWLAHPALVIPGIALLLFELLLIVRRSWLLRRFAEAVQSPAEQLPQPAEYLTDASDIPLALPLARATATSQSAQAASWPAELLEFTHDAIIIWEMDGAGIVYWNRAAEELYGYTREEARGRVTHELLKTQLAGGVQELESRLARYGVWVGELLHTRSDGRRVEVEGRLSLMSQRHRPWLVLEVNRDVTDRNRAEAARRAMEKQLNQLRGSVE